MSGSSRSVLEALALADATIAASRSAPRRPDEASSHMGPSGQAWIAAQNVAPRQTYDAPINSTVRYDILHSRAPTLASSHHLGLAHAASAASLSIRLPERVDSATIASHAAMTKSIAADIPINGVKALRSSPVLQQPSSLTHSATWSTQSVTRNFEASFGGYQLETAHEIVQRVLNKYNVPSGGREESAPAPALDRPSLPGGGQHQLSSPQSASPPRRRVSPSPPKHQSYAAKASWRKSAASMLQGEEGETMREAGPRQAPVVVRPLPAWVSPTSRPRAEPPRRISAEATKAQSPGLRPGTAASSARSVPHSDAALSRSGGTTSSAASSPRSAVASAVPSLRSLGTARSISTARSTRAGGNDNDGDGDLEPLASLTKRLLTHKLQQQQARGGAQQTVEVPLEALLVLVAKVASKKKASTLPSFDYVAPRVPSAVVPPRGMHQNWGGGGRSRSFSPPRGKGEAPTSAADSESFHDGEATTLLPQAAPAPRLPLHEELRRLRVEHARSRSERPASREQRRVDTQMPVSSAQWSRTGAGSIVNTTYSVKAAAAAGALELAGEKRKSKVRVSKNDSIDSPQSAAVTMASGPRASNGSSAKQVQPHMAASAPATYLHNHVLGSFYSPPQSSERRDSRDSPTALPLPPVFSDAQFDPRTAASRALLRLRMRGWKAAAWSPPEHLQPQLAQSQSQLAQASMAVGSSHSLLRAPSLSPQPKVPSHIVPRRSRAERPSTAAAGRAQAQSRQHGAEPARAHGQVMAARAAALSRELQQREQQQEQLQQQGHALSPSTADERVPDEEHEPPVHAGSESTVHLNSALPPSDQAAADEEGDGGARTPAVSPAPCGSLDDLDVMAGDSDEDSESKGTKVHRGSWGPIAVPLDGGAGSSAAAAASPPRSRTAAGGALGPEDQGRAAAIYRTLAETSATLARRAATPHSPTTSPQQQPQSAATPLPAASAGQLAPETPPAPAASPAAMISLLLENLFVAGSHPRSDELQAAACEEGEVDSLAGDERDVQL